ncbi:MAG: SPASM domain-containing protein [Campylobacter sp.]|nr:SPASM domain-containing protein [Campylobacter sp.]
MKCKFCPISKNSRPIMSVDEFKRVLDEFDGKSEIFVLHVLGDPLIIKNLSEYLKIADEKGANLELTTSGVWLNKTKADMVLNARAIRQINISLTSFFWQNSVSLDEYLDEIFYLCDEFEPQSKRFVNLRLWNFDDKFNPLNNNEIFYNKLTKHFGVSVEENSPKIRLKDHIILTKAMSFNWPVISPTSFKKGTCHALKHQIAVLSDGRVVPCCMDAVGIINLGNIFENSLDEILSSKRAKEMRSGFDRGELVERLCQSCEFAKLKVRKV